MLDPQGRLQNSAHTDLPWRINCIANDFELTDVWALHTPGGPDEFPRLMSLLQSLDPAETSPLLGALFAIRRRMGGRLSMHPFRPLYVTDDEAAFEIANQTLHGVLHLGWVADGMGGYRGQLAVLVKPNGLLGRAYMTAIAPFRRFLYPRLLNSVSQRWHQHARQIDVPARARALSTLPRIDYADAFLLNTEKQHPDWTAETWARAVLEGAPAATRAELTTGWSALGLPPTNSSASVLGWAIRHSTSEYVLLARDSRIGMPGELLFERRADGLLFATFVYHRTPATRAVWAAVRRTHVRTVLELLDRTVADGSADVTLNPGNQ